MNHCKNCGNNIPDETSTCAEAGFGDGCGKTLRGESEDLKKEWERELNNLELLNYCEHHDCDCSVDKDLIKSFISSLLAKQQEEVVKMITPYIAQPCCSCSGNYPCEHDGQRDMGEALIANIKSKLNI